MVQDGATTPVRLGQVQLAPNDKKVLCSAMCQCDKMPDAAKDGKQRKPGCVAGRLQALDPLRDHPSPYMQDINYDMTKSPPAPIMDSGVATRGHRYLPGWMQKYWRLAPEQARMFKAEQGLIRRADVVIVNDPRRPPTQDNIRQIVDMTFPPDAISRSRASACETIAGGEAKVVTLQADQCGCDTPGQDASRIPVDKLGWAAVVAGSVVQAMSRGRAPHPPERAL